MHHHFTFFQVRAFAPSRYNHSVVAGPANEKRNAFHITFGATRKAKLLQKFNISASLVCNKLNIGQQLTVFVTAGRYHATAHHQAELRNQRFNQRFKAHFPCTAFLIDFHGSDLGLFADFTALTFLDSG